MDIFVKRGLINGLRIEWMCGCSEAYTPLIMQLEARKQTNSNDLIGDPIAIY